MKTIARRKTRRPKWKSSFFSGKGTLGCFGMQTKLAVGKPGDLYEKEADSVADKIVEHSYTGSQFFNAANRSEKGFIRKKPLAENITPLVQKQEEELQRKQLVNIQRQEVEEEEEPVQMQTEEEEEEMEQMQPEKEEEIQAGFPEGFEDEEYLAGQVEEEEEVQAKSMGETAVVPSTESSIKSSAGDGNKLDSSTRSEMEAGFGIDFSKVNIHTGSLAVQINKELGAQAFTHGNDIYFNEGKYNPESREGKHLLAHELTHTIQQTKDSIQLFSYGEVNAKTGIKDLNTHTSDNKRIQRKRFDSKENLQSRRFSGKFELELVYDNQSLIFNGSAGETVTIIQNALEDFGYPLKDYGVDGIFGSETEKSVRDFQTDNNAVMIDGIIGPETMRLLDFHALKIEKGKNEKREEENIDEAGKTILQKVEEELKKGSGDKRAEYALCILDLYKTYRSHQKVYDKYMGIQIMLPYIENDRGNKLGNTFKHPGKFEKSSFNYLDRHVSKNAATFTRALLSEANSILEGINMVGLLSRNPYYAMPHKHTLEFLIAYLSKRMKKPNDIYSCFR